MTSKTIQAGLNWVFVGVNGTDGNPIGGDATGAAAGASAGSAFQHMNGAKTVPVQVPDAEAVDVTGDDGTEGQFVFEAAGSPNGVIQFSDQDLDLEALFQSTNVVNLGNITYGTIDPDAPEYRDLNLIVQGRAKSQVSGEGQAKRWAGWLIPSCQLVPLNRDAFTERTAASMRYSLIANKGGNTPWGSVMSLATQGTTRASMLPFVSDYPLHMHVYQGNGVQDTFTLTYTPAAEDDDSVIIHVDGVLQSYTTDYTVSGKIITFEAGAIPANGAYIRVLYEWDE